METGRVGVRGSCHNSLFCSQPAPNLFFPPRVTLLATTFLPRQLGRLYRLHTTSWEQATTTQTHAWSCVSPQKVPSENQASAGCSTRCTGCRRAHLPKPAVTPKITYRDLREVLKSPPQLQDQMLVIVSYNENPTSCKPFGVLTTCGHSSGFN